MVDNTTNNLDELGLSNESSIKLGYGTPNCLANTSALAKLSRVNMPINCTSEYFWESAIKVGTSALHGAHQDAQTFTTATLLSANSNLLPYKVSPDNFGATWRSFADMKVTAPLPEIKLS